MENKLGVTAAAWMNRDRSRWVKESEKKRRKYAELFFPAPWGKSAFKFLQFIAYSTSPAPKCYFHSYLISFSFLVHKMPSFVCVVAPILICSATLFSLLLIFSSKDDVKFEKEDPCKKIFRSLFCFSFG